MTSRPKCWYGAKCYRKNPLHKRDFCHPRDPDWSEEDEGGDEAGGKGKQQQQPTQTASSKKRAKPEEQGDGQQDTNSAMPNKRRAVEPKPFTATHLVLKAGELMHSTSGKSARKRS